MRDLNSPKSLSDQYIANLYPQELSPLIAKARQASEQFGKSGISMSANEARQMAFVIKTAGAKKFVEIGTLTGATAIWICEAMGSGSTLWTFEKDQAHANAAEKIFNEYINLNSDRSILILKGDAQEMLATISKQGPFDGIFIDGNKAAYGKYLEWAEINIKKGGLIISDNVFLGGSVFSVNTESKFSEKQVQVMQAFNARIADTHKYFSAILPTAEGLSVAIKLF